MLPLHIITIVLDGMPFLPAQFFTLNRLTIPWTWHIIHGAAGNTGSTSWCRPQTPRLSTDGSTYFLRSIEGHPRIQYFESERWENKDVMVNHALPFILEPCVLMQMDADELWTAEKITKFVEFASMTQGPRAFQFSCRYFVGPNIVTVGQDCYGANRGEWLRAWTFRPGMTFARHEPPVIQWTAGALNMPVSDLRSEPAFDHPAYVFEHQVAYKERFYGYANAVEHWRRLQANTVWPVTRLKDFLPWVDERAGAALLHKI